MFDCLLSTPFGIGLTLSWRRPLSYRSQSIDFLCKSMDWFQYDNGLRHERVNVFFAGLKWLFLTWSFHSLDIVLVWVGDCSYIRIKSHILRDFVLVLVLEPLVVFFNSQYRLGSKYTSVHSHQWIKMSFCTEVGTIGRRNLDTSLRRAWLDLSKYIQKHSK